MIRQLAGQLSRIEKVLSATDLKQVFAEEIAAPGASPSSNRISSFRGLPSVVAMRVVGLCPVNRRSRHPERAHREMRDLALRTNGSCDIGRSRPRGPAHVCHRRHKRTCRSVRRGVLRCMTGIGAAVKTDGKKRYAGVLAALEAHGSRLTPRTA